jgi:hypothetical protein
MNNLVELGVLMAAKVPNSELTANGNFTEEVNWWLIFEIPDRFAMFEELNVSSSI